MDVCGPACFGVTLLFFHPTCCFSVALAARQAFNRQDHPPVQPPPSSYALQRFFLLERLAGILVLSDLRCKKDVGPVFPASSSHRQQSSFSIRKAPFPPRRARTAPSSAMPFWEEEIALPQHSPPPDRYFSLLLSPLTWSRSLKKMTEPSEQPSHKCIWFTETRSALLLAFPIKILPYTPLPMK